MKQFSLIGFASALLFFSSCITKGSLAPSENGKHEDEVVFYKNNYRDYGWKDYDDSVKIKPPRIVSVRVYPIAYKLSAKELTITKYDRGSPDKTKDVLFRKNLDPQQQKRFKQIMQQINLQSVKDASSATSTYVVEDGFTLNVLLTKGGQQHVIYWDNKYVQDLVNLLSLVNGLSPDKFRFYKNEKEFIDYLKRNP